MSARKENVLKGLRLLEEYKTRLEGTDELALQGVLKNAIAAIRSSLFTAVLDIHEAHITSLELSKEVQLIEAKDRFSTGGSVLMTSSDSPSSQEASKNLTFTTSSSKELPNQLQASTNIVRVQRSISYANAMEKYSTSVQDANQNLEKDFSDSSPVMNQFQMVYLESQEDSPESESQNAHPESESQKAHPESESQNAHPESESQKAHPESESLTTHPYTQGETHPVPQRTCYSSEEVCPESQKFSIEPAKVIQSKREEILTIVIDKKSSGLGISISGGVDKPLFNGSTGIYITKIIPGTLAARDGRLKLGDHLLSVNGTSLENVMHNTAVETLKQAKAITLVIIRMEGQNGITSQTLQK